jgi:hypothetical protein
MQVQPDRGSQFVSDLGNAKVVVGRIFGGRSFKVGKEICTLRELVAKLNKMIDNNEIREAHAKDALNHILRLSIAPPPKDADLQWILVCRKIQNTYGHIIKLAKRVTNDLALFQRQTQVAEILRDHLHGNVIGLDLKQNSANALFKIMYTKDQMTPKENGLVRKVFPLRRLDDILKAESVFLKLEKCCTSREEKTRLLALLNVVCGSSQCPNEILDIKARIQGKISTR